MQDQLKDFAVSDLKDQAKLHKSMDGGPKILQQDQEDRDSNMVAKLKREELSSIDLERMEISKDKFSGKGPSSVDPYNAHMLNSKVQAQLINDYKNAPDLNCNSYLSDNELHFLQKLSNNEALLEYFHYL